MALGLRLHQRRRRRRGLCWKVNTIFGNCGNLSIRMNTCEHQYQSGLPQKLEDCVREQVLFEKAVVASVLHKTPVDFELQHV